MLGTSSLDPNSQGYTNALLEDIDDKFQIILEQTQAIPQLQRVVAQLEVRVEEMSILVDVTFEEVGKLRAEVDEVKRKIETIEVSLSRSAHVEQDLADLRQRVSDVESRIR